LSRNILIDLLRIILLAWIVLFHYTVHYNKVYGVDLPFRFTFENGGTVGVAIFFIISGFFAATSLLRQADHGPRQFGRYCLRRYMRFWPLFIICCVAIVGSQFFISAGERDCTPLQFIQNLLIFPIGKGARHVDGAHWFLETLLLIQFIFALALLAPPKKRLNILMIIVGINAACSLLYIATDIKIFDRIAKILGNRHYIWCVFIGIVTALLIEKGPKLLADYKNRANRPLLCALFMALVLWCAVYAKLGSIWFPVYTALFIAAIIIRPAMPAKIATFIGAVAGVTLAWYLVHQNMGYALIGTLVPRGTNPEVAVILACAVTLAVAWACTRLDKLLHK